MRRVRRSFSQRERSGKKLTNLLRASTGSSKLCGPSQRLCSACDIDYGEPSDELSPGEIRTVCYFSISGDDAGIPRVPDATREDEYTSRLCFTDHGMCCFPHFRQFVL